MKLSVMHADNGPGVVYHAYVTAKKSHDSFLCLTSLTCIEVYRVLPGTRISPPFSRSYTCFDWFAAISHISLLASVDNVKHNTHKLTYTWI